MGYTGPYGTTPFTYSAPITVACAKPTMLMPNTQLQVLAYDLSSATVNITAQL